MSLRWLVDECVSARIVGELRAAGHDVIYVVEFAPGADDREVADCAKRDGRILLTDEKPKIVSRRSGVSRPLTHV